MHINTALWIAQGLLGLVFAGSGGAKAIMSPEKMAATGQTGVAAELTPFAAIGLGLIMLGAARIHTRLREPKNVVVNLALLALCLFVVWGRFDDLTEWAARYR